MKRTNSVSSGRTKKIPLERPADRSEKITGVCAAVCAVICAAALCFFSVGTLTGEKKDFVQAGAFGNRVTYTEPEGTDEWTVSQYFRTIIKNVFGLEN